MFWYKQEDLKKIKELNFLNLILDPFWIYFVTCAFVNKHFHVFVFFYDSWI
jgi:hypothetical protein